MQTLRTIRSLESLDTCNRKKKSPPINALKKHAQIIKITQLNMTV